MEEKIAHLGFIQGVINRMGNNSFLIKGWTVTLVAAIVALANKDANGKFMYLALLPALIFWILDAYYLRQERLFRELFKAVAKDAVTGEKFAMDTAKFKDGVESVFEVMLSKTLSPFYLLIVAILAFFIWKFS